MKEEKILEKKAWGQEVEYDLDRKVDPGGKGRWDYNWVGERKDQRVNSFSTKQPPTNFIPRRQTTNLQIHASPALHIPRSHQCWSALSSCPWNWVQQPIQGTVSDPTAGVTIQTPPPLPARPSTFPKITGRMCDKCPCEVQGVVVGRCQRFWIKAPYLTNLSPKHTVAIRDRKVKFQKSHWEPFQMENKY